MISADGTHIPNISSMYLLWMRMFERYFGRILFSWIAKNKFAYVGAGGVPMAVPVNCSQNVSPNWNTLFRIMIDSAWMRASAGRCLNWSLRWWIWFAILMRALPVLMLVYIEVAPAVNSQQPIGSGDIGMSRSLRTLEFFR